ncbi:UNVERIFIED_CONTAM: hypothetical protein FKN15_033430 [Acipenser sinensis]
MEVDVDSATEEACKFPQVPGGEAYGSRPYKMGQYNLWDSYESFIKDFVRSSKLQVHLNRRFMEHSAVFSEGIGLAQVSTFTTTSQQRDPSPACLCRARTGQYLHNHITAKRPISSLPLQGSHRSVPSQPHHSKETHLQPASAGLAQVSTFTTTSQQRDPSPACLCRARTGQYLHNHITAKRPISSLPLQGSHRSVPSQPHHSKETHLQPASAGLAQVSTFTTTSQQRDPSPACLCRARTGQYLHNHITAKRPISSLPLQGSHRSVPSQPHHSKETHLQPASAGLAQVSTFTTTSQQRDPSPACLCRARTGQYLHNHITAKRPISSLPLQGSHRSVPSQPHHSKETHLQPASAGLAQVSTFTTTSQQRDPSPACLCRARTGQYLHNHITAKRPISSLPLQGSHRSVPSQPHHSKETHLQPASAGLAQVSTFTTTSQQRDPSPACLCRARTGQYLHNHITAKRPISSLPLQGSHRSVPSQPHHSKETHLQPASAGLAQVSTFTTTSQQRDPSPACLCRARTGQYLHNHITAKRPISSLPLQGSHRSVPSQPHHSKETHLQPASAGLAQVSTFTTTSQQRDPSPACLCRARTGQYLHNHITAKRPISSLPLQGSHRSVPSQPHHSKETHLQPASAGLAQVSTFTTTSQQRDPSPACLCRARTGQYLHNHITAKRPISSLPLQGSHRSVPSQPHHSKETHLQPASAGLAQVSTFTTTSQQRDPSPACLCRARTGQYLHNHITAKRPISSLPLQGSHRSVPSQPHHSKETHLQPASAGLAQVSTFTTTSQQRDPSPACLCRARTGQYLHNHITAKRPISSLPLQGSHRSVPSQPHHSKETHLQPASAGLAQVSTFTTTSQQRDPSPACLCRARTGQYLHNHITAKRPISSLPLQGSHRSVPSQPHHSKETHLQPASAGLAQVSTFTTTSQQRDPSPACLCRARTGQYLHNHITAKRPISSLPLQGSHRSVPSQPHHSKETHLQPASAGLAQVSTFTTTSQQRDPSPACLCRARTGQYLHNHITAKRPISSLPLQGSHRSVPSQPHHSKETHLQPASAGLAQVSTFTTTSQQRDPSPACLCRARTGQYLHNHITAKRPISSLPLQGSHRSVPSQPHHSKETHLQPASAGLAQVSTFTTTSQQRDPSPACLCRARTGQYLHNHITAKRPISSLPLQGSHRSVPSQPHHSKETHLQPASAGLAQVSTFTTTSQQRDPSPACLCRARTGQYLHNHITAKRPISSLPLQGSHRSVPSQPHHSKETHLQPASAGLAQVSTFTTTSQQRDPSPACLCRARTGQYLHNHITAKRPISSLPLQGSHRSVPSQPHHSKETHLQPASAGLAQVSTFTTTSQQRDPSPACLCRARTGQYLHNHITAKRPISSLPLQGSHRSVPSQPHHSKETHLQPASAGLAQVSTFTTTSQQRDPSPACLCRARTGQYLHNHITAKRPISSLPLQGSHRTVPSQHHITAKRPISSLPLQGSHRRPWISEYNDIYGALFRSFSGHHRHTPARSDPSKSSVLYIPHPPPARSSSQIKQQYQTEYRQAYTAPRIVLHFPDHIILFLNHWTTQPPIDYEPPAASPIDY